MSVSDFQDICNAVEEESKKELAALVKKAVASLVEKFDEAGIPIILPGETSSIATSSFILAGRLLRSMLGDIVKSKCVFELAIAECKRAEEIHTEQD
jgi:hypothetical protein